MNQSKTIYLIFALIGLVVLVMLVQVLKFSEKPNPNPNNKVSPQPIIEFTPPPKFKIVSTNISSQPVEVNEAVKITFDRPVDNEGLALEISPKEEVVILFNSSLTELSIKPANAWDYNTSYTITIPKSIRAQDNQFLDKDYEFSFQTEPRMGI
ncbi:MAG: Ig-like domain-containing protein [Candidatus Daviesbacteria bacterium]|nr:Ig-like domain-containing protein [Candidatus Daviesbacteria bacterium]